MNSRSARRDSESAISAPFPSDARARQPSVDSPDVSGLGATDVDVAGTETDVGDPGAVVLDAPDGPRPQVRAAYASRSARSATAALNRYCCTSDCTRSRVACSSTGVTARNDFTLV